MGVNKIAGSVGWAMLPPAATLYAVEPVGVASNTPSACVISWCAHSRNEWYTNLHSGDEPPSLKALNLGQKRAAPSVHHHFIEHLVHLARHRFPAAVDLAEQSHAQGDVHAALVRVVGVAALQLVAPTQHAPQVFAVRLKLVVGEEAHGAEVEADDGGDVRVEERAGVQDDAVAAQTHNKIDDLHRC